MGFWLTIVVVVYFFVCISMVLLILLQAGKGGGLSGLAGASMLSETFGASGAEKSLSKITTWLAVVFFILSVGLTFVGSRYFKQTSLLDQLAEEEVQATVTTPAVEAGMGTPVPAQTTPIPSDGQVTIPEQPVQPAQTGTVSISESDAVIELKSSGATPEAAVTEEQAPQPE